MGKVIMEGWGSRQLVLDADVVSKIEELIEGFEIYEEVRHRDDEYTYHIYEPNARQIMRDGVSFKVISTVSYNLAKLAGRPPKR